MSSLVLGLLCSCLLPPIAGPAAKVSFSVLVETNEIEFGVAFPVTCVRTWTKDLEPAAWADEWLTPLTLDLQNQTVEDRENHIQEIREYAAFAFTLDESITLAASFGATSKIDRSEVTATADKVVLKVIPSIDRRQPGPVELPDGPLAEPKRSWLWLWLLSAGFLTWMLWRKFRSATQTPPRALEPAATTNYAQAKLRLKSLQEQSLGNAANIQRVYLDAWDLTRQFIHGEYRVFALNHTSEEFLGAVPSIENLHRNKSFLTEFLSQCDRVKFGRQIPNDTTCRTHLQGLAQFLDDPYQVAQRQARNSS